MKAKLCIPTTPSAPIENFQLLNRLQAAAALGVSKRTVSDLVASRELIFIKIGTRLLFDPADLRAYAESCKVKGGSK